MWIETFSTDHARVRLLRQVAERLAGRVREPAAAADPRAVEALAEEEREQRERDQRAEEAPGHDQERLLQDHRRVEVLDLQRPEVREVVLAAAGTPAAPAAARTRAPPARRRRTAYARAGSGCCRGGAGRKHLPRPSPACRRCRRAATCSAAPAAGRAPSRATRPRPAARRSAGRAPGSGRSRAAGRRPPARRRATRRATSGCSPGAGTCSSARPASGEPSGRLVHAEAGLELLVELRLAQVREHPLEGAPLVDPARAAARGPSASRAC